MTAEQTTEGNNNREWRVRGVTPAPSQQADTLADQLQATQRRLEMLSRQLDGMSRRVDGIGYSLDQVRPVAERTLSDHQMVQAVLQATETLALQVQGLVHNRMINEQVPPEIQAMYEMQYYHAQARTRRQQEVERNLSYIARLEKCLQETTEWCTCGNHRGIRFIETVERIGVGQATEHEQVILEENLCPKDWWFMLSRLAYKRGELSTFTSSYPFADFLFAYAVN